MATVKVREATDDDAPFIIDSWLRSYLRVERGARPARGPVDAKREWQGHRQVVLRLIKRCGVLIAQSVADPLIAGWSCSEPGLLHYVYVRQNLRRFGVAKALLERVGEVRRFSHWTPGTKHIAKAEWAYDEYAAYLSPEERHAAETGTR